MVADFDATYGGQECQGYTCAWKNTKKGYLFGHYATSKDAMEDVMRCPAGQRYGFELLRPESLCRAYFDVEWVGVQDQKHEIVSRIQAQIVEMCWEEYCVRVKVLLLYDMVEFVNHHLPDTTAKLKLYNITLHQKQYKEDRVVDFDDVMWGQFKFITRTARNKATTLRDVLSCIHVLSKKLFGKYFTDQKKTHRQEKSKKSKKLRKIMCYNYVTDESLLSCFIQMAWWGDKDADDFHPEIVEKYKIKGRIQQDKAAALLCIPTTVMRIVNAPVVHKVETAAIFEE